MINEKDVSFGQGSILEVVRVRKINEILRACRGDETHAQIVRDEEKEHTSRDMGVKGRMRFLTLRIRQGYMEGFAALGIF